MMKFMDYFAYGIGYTVMILSTLGALTDMKFTIRFTGPDTSLATIYTCESGDSIATRKKYPCSREEMEAQQAKPKD